VRQYSVKKGVKESRRDPFGEGREEKGEGKKPIGESKGLGARGRVKDR